MESFKIGDKIRLKIDEFVIGSEEIKDSFNSMKYGILTIKAIEDKGMDYILLTVEEFNNQIGVMKWEIIKG